MTFRYALLFTLGMLAAGAAHAGETLSGWLDLRLANAGGEASWRDGGFGKLRYGDQTRLEIAQAAVLWTPRLADTVTATITLMCATPDCDRAGFSEVFFRWKPVPRSPVRYTLRAGQFFLPVSLEHDGPGWTPTRSLTPSALTSWIGEEGLVDGIEATISHAGERQRVGLTAGLFGGADTAGTLLTFRGWALHDLTSGTDTRLPLPASHDKGWATLFMHQSPASRPHIELDGRAGAYLRLDWQPPAPLTFNLFLFNNPGKPTLVTNGQYGWTTRFAAVGVRWQAADRTEVLAQLLGGTTKMGAVMPDGRHPADIAYDAAYVLVCRHFTDGGRITGRIDSFGVRDRSLRDLDDNSDRGYALTVAWLKPVTDHLDVAAEAVQVDSRHPARVTQDLAPDQTQTQLQVALKVHF